MENESQPETQSNAPPESITTVCLNCGKVFGSRTTYYLDEKEEEEIMAELEEAPDESSEVGRSLYPFLFKCLRFYNNHYTACYMLTLPLMVIAARQAFGNLDSSLFQDHDGVYPDENRLAESADRYTVLPLIRSASFGSSRGHQRGFGPVIGKKVCNRAS